MSIEEFAELVQTQQKERLNEKYPGSRQAQELTVQVIPGRRYTKVDIGWRGAFMVENATGEIFGIRGYGQANRKHAYGTLDTTDQWYWGDFYPVRKEQADA